MSKVIKAVVGAVLIVAGVITGNFALIIAGAQLVGSALLTPKGGKPRAAVATMQVGEVPRQAIVGKAATAGSLVDAFNYGGKDGTDWECLVLALADHKCDGLEGFYVNDVYVAFGGDGDVAGYNSQLKVFFRNGTETQVLPSVITTNGAGWTANDNGAGVCFVTVCYKADDTKSKSPIWPNGRPRFLWVLRGALCYDSRRDATVGGAGTHLWSNPATRQWSENALVCRYNFARGFYACDRVGQPDQLLIGRGLSATEAPPANLFARANLCDEVVDGIPRYRVGGVIEANETFIEVENDFAAACAGTISQPEGAVEIDPGEARAPVMTFTDRDLVVGSKVKRRWFLGTTNQEWVNTVIGSYIEPAHKWSAHSAPVRRDVADVLADKAPRETTLQLGFVTWVKQAGRIAEIVRRLGRLYIRAELVLPPRFCELEEGDWVVWQSDRYLKGQAFTFRVEAWGSDRGWQHNLVLRQISATCYSDTAALTSGSVAVNQPPRGAIGAPDAGSWAVVSGRIQGGGVATPALIVTGAVADPSARFVRLEYCLGAAAPTGATIWNDAGVTGPDIKRREIAVAAGGIYRVGVSYVIDGVQGDRLILGPVTALPVAYPDGTAIEALQPSQAGADVTAANTAAAIVGQGPGATALAADVLNAAVALGQNRIINSDFVNGMTGFQANENNGFSGLFQGLNLSGYFGRINVAYAYSTDATPPSFAFCDSFITRGFSNPSDLRRWGQPLLGGERLYYSMLLSAYRCASTLFLVFLDASGAQIGSTSSFGPSNSVSPAAENGDNMTRIGAFVTAPANAKGCLLFARMVNPGNFPYLFYAQPFLAVVAPNQTAIPPYTSGPTNRLIGVTDNADVTAANTAAAILGQASWATFNGLVPTNVSGQIQFLDTGGNLDRLDRVANRRMTLLKRADGSTDLTEAAAITNQGTAAAIAGQGAFATQSSVAYGSSFLSGFGALAPLNQVAIGAAGRVYRDDGTTRLTDAAAVTSLGTAAAVAGQGILATRNNIDPSTAQMLAYGSIPPTVPDGSFSYSSTTTTMTISWTSFTVYRADLSAITISAGSVAVTGLSAGTGYRVYPYMIDGGGSTGTVTFAAVASGVGSPGICYTGVNALAAATMFSRGNIPLYTFQIFTPASGSGGGTGGGNTCLHPDQEIGFGLARDLQVGSLVPTPSGLRPVVRLERRPASRWFRILVSTGHSLCVTPKHRFFLATGTERTADELQLGDILATSGDHVEVRGLMLDYEPDELVQIELDDPHLYYLGSAELLCHNPKP